MLTGKIDVTKIEKDRLFKSEKTGSIYLDIVLIETPESEYNDFVILQSLSKEERLAGQKGHILGNADMVSKKSVDTVTDKAPAKDEDKDDIPF